MTMSEIGRRLASTDSVKSDTLDPALRARILSSVSYTEGAAAPAPRPRHTGLGHPLMLAGGVLTAVIVVFALANPFRGNLQESRSSIPPAAEGHAGPFAPGATANGKGGVPSEESAPAVSPSNGQSMPKTSSLAPPSGSVVAGSGVARPIDGAASKSLIERFANQSADRSKTEGSAMAADAMRQSQGSESNVTTGYGKGEKDDERSKSVGQGSGVPDLHANNALGASAASARPSPVAASAVGDLAKGGQGAGRHVGSTPGLQSESQKADRERPAFSSPQTFGGMPAGKKPSGLSFADGNAGRARARAIVRRKVRRSSRLSPHAQPRASHSRRQP